MFFKTSFSISNVTVSSFTARNSVVNKVNRGSQMAESTFYSVPSSLLKAEQNGRRRRRKTVRSCTFCRQRKLKCDQQKPVCGSCKTRKLPECVYTDGFNFQLTSDELFEATPNVALIKRIQQLEDELKQLHNNDPEAVNKEEPLQENFKEIHGYTGGNKVLDFRFLTIGQDSYVCYGPTAIQTAITASGERFVVEYRKLWQRVEIECLHWESTHTTTLKQERSPSECPLDGTVIEAVIKDLPSSNVMFTHLKEFFESPLHEYYQFLDEEKVLFDFNSCFVHTSSIIGDADASETMSLARHDEKSLFIIGIVTELLCFTYFKKNVPVSIQDFRIWLTGLSVTELSYIEKAQYLLLQYLFKVYNSQGDVQSPHLANLVSNLCNTTINLGLHEDIFALYEGQEYLVGRLCTLQNLFYWTLFADLHMAFDMGRPLHITDEYFDDFKLSTNERGRIPLLRNYLYIGRKCMKEVFDPHKDPDLEHLIDELISFMEQHFRPIRYYTDRKLVQQVDLFEIMILSPVLMMIANFYNLRRILCTELTMIIKNGFIKFVLMSLSLSINTILRCYELDQEYYPDEIFSNEKDLTPFLHLSLLLGNSLLMRSMMELYGLFFFKVALFEKGLIVSTDQGMFDLSLDDFDVPGGDFLSFRGIFNKFRLIFDELFRPEYSTLHRILINSHYFTKIIALEKVNRTIFEKGLESRTQVEVDHNWSQVDFDQISDEIFQMMTDNFWANYNQKFSGLIQMDPSCFLTDFDQFSQSI